MADQSNISYKAGEATGHAQAKKDEVMEKARDATSAGRETCQDAGSAMQQASQQMKSMAQGAADAAKNATGFGGSGR